MEPIICELYEEAYDDSYRLITEGGKYLFCNTNKLDAYNSGDYIYCVNWWAQKVFFTVAAGAPMPVQRHPEDSSPGILYQGNWYGVIRGQAAQRLKVLEQQPLPSHWSFPVLTENLLQLFKTSRAEPRRKPIIHMNETTLKETTSFEVKHRQFLMACKTRPFLILAGPVGIGKSSLVRTMAYKTCANPALQLPHKPGNFELIPVKEDWQDSTELLGYLSTQTGQYKGRPFIRFLVKAWLYPAVPFFACLDEMNMARVENYFAEYLSVSETRRIVNGRLQTDTLISALEIQTYADQDPFFWQQLGLTDDMPLCRELLKHGLSIPHNLIIVGTINKADSKYPLSRRVLDRAMMIEVKTPDLFSGLTAQPQDDSYDTIALMDDIIPDVASAYHEYTDYCDNILNALAALQEALTDTPFTFAYRVRNDALLYSIYNKELLSIDDCIDEILLMKILPSIEGSIEKCYAVIQRLLAITANGYPKSFAKLSRMSEVLDESGYISYWLA
jgi:hypothetical protein